MDQKQDENENLRASHGSHTPGPWRVAKNGRSVIAGGMKINQSSGPMAASCAVGESHNARLLANAKLIAAAPEMLEACWATIRYLETRADAESNQLWGQVSAAYRKACGIED